MKAEQLKVLCHVRNLSDVLVILPTGFGKTLIMMLILAVLNMHSRQGVLILIVPGLVQHNNHMNTIDFVNMLICMVMMWSIEL